MICGRRGIAQAYATGRGKLTVRAKIHHEQTKNGRDQLIVTEIPYQVSKNDGIINTIVECRKNDRLHDISNIIDNLINDPDGASGRPEL